MKEALQPKITELCLIFRPIGSCRRSLPLPPRSRRRLLDFSSRSCRPLITFAHFYENARWRNHLRQSLLTSYAKASNLNQETSVFSVSMKNDEESRSKSNNPVKKPRRVTIDDVLKASQETKEKREQRIRNLFSFFDKENSGIIDYAQIEAGLSALPIPPEYKHAKDFLKACDANKDGLVAYKDFKKYVDNKEIELYRLFQAIDVEHNGCIIPEELCKALVKAGIQIDEEEVAVFMDHVDKDNNGVITFQNWRDFLLLYPKEATIENIYRYIERVCLIDIGEQTVSPTGISGNIHAGKYLLAGGLAGAASRTATAPLDRLKIILQIQTTRAHIMPALKNIWKQEGFFGFFRGNGLNVLKVAPESAIRFYTYETLKTWIVNSRGDDIGTVGHVLAGGMAGGIAQTAIYPMDLIKTRVQTYAYRHGGRINPRVGALSKEIWVHEGPRAFYRGLVPSLLGMIPYAGIDIAAYEALKDMSKKYILHDGEHGPLVQLGCGTVSGALGATCVYPLQVVRTRMQAQRANASSTSAYNGMREVFKRTYEHEGFRGFYKGIFPNLLKVIPSASITYVLYETIKKDLQLE